MEWINEGTGIIEQQKHQSHQKAQQGRGHISLSVARLLELAEIFECGAADLLNTASDRIQDHERHLMSMLNRLETKERMALLGLIEQLIHWKLNTLGIEQELE